MVRESQPKDPPRTARLVRRKTGPKATAVQVANAHRGAIREVFSATGTIAARQEAKLSFKAPGRIETVSVNVGQAIRKGEIIALLDQSDFLAGVRQAEAGLKTAQAGIALAEAQVALARVALGRMKGLYADESIPKGQLDDVQAKYDMAAAGLMVAKAHEEQAAAGLEAARNQLANTVLRAPFEGVVASKSGSVGETIGPGVPILVLADLSAAKVKFDLPESAYGKVRVGTRVDVSVDSYPGHQQAVLERPFVVLAHGREPLGKAMFGDVVGDAAPDGLRRLDVDRRAAQDGGEHFREAGGACGCGALRRREGGHPAFGDAGLEQFRQQRRGADGMGEHAGRAERVSLHDRQP